MIKLRHQQPSLWHRGLSEDIEGLWEPWMLVVDKLLCYRRESTRSDRKLLKLRNTDGYLKRFQ